MSQLIPASEPDASDVTPAWRPSATRVRYQVLAVGWSLALLTYIQRLAFVRAVPKIQGDLGFDKEQAALLGFAFLVAYGIFQVPCGLIGDRFGARNVLTGLVIGWSLVTGMSTLALHLAGVPTGAFAMLLGIRFLFGSFQAGGFPVWARVVADWIPMSERGTAQGTVWMFSRIGGAFSPFIFQWLYDYCGNWQTPLWIVAAIGLVWCALFWPWFRNCPADKSTLNAAERELIEAGRPPAVVVGPVPWRALFSSTNVWALSLMYGCVGFAGNFITNLLPVYLSDDRRLSDTVTTRITALPLAMGAISCVLGGFLSDRLTRRIGRKWGRRLVPAIGMACTGVVVTAVPHVESVWLLAFLFGTWFFGNDLMIGPAWASCVDVGERYAGTVSGTMNMIGQFAGAAGLWFAGRMLQGSRAETLFLVFGGSYALAALCWMAVDVTRPLVKSSEAPAEPN